MSFGGAATGDGLPVSPRDAPPPDEAAVLDLSQIRGTDAGRVGPKIARLGQLAREGWRVPDGYAVTVDAMTGWLSPNVREELARFVTGAPAAGAHELAAARDLIEARPRGVAGGGRGRRARAARRADWAW